MHYLSYSLLVLTAVVLAIPAPDGITTNGERLANHLPPLPPKRFGRTLPGHDVRAEVARARASTSPSLPHTPHSPVVRSYAGSIAVRNLTTNALLGYVEDTQKGAYTIHSGSRKSALRVSFRATASGNGPFDIIAEDPKFSGPAFLGGKTSSSPPVLDVNSGAVLEFGSVHKTPQLSRPVKVANEFTESSIWSINPQTKELTPHWVNPNGSLASTKIALLTGQNVLFFTGCIDEYNHDHPAAPADLVTFYFDSD